MVPIEFLTLDEVATELGVGVHVARSLVRDGELPALRRSGRFVVERGMFERWIQGQYAEAKAFVLTHPR